MRYIPFLAAALALAPLAGCSDQRSPSAPSLLPAMALSPDLNLHVKLLAVSDAATGGVVILNRSGKKIEFIIHGLGQPDGDWIDSKGNLYVADAYHLKVQEYVPGRKRPAFTYSHGLIGPVAITTDASLNVYIGDYTASKITEYRQGSDKVVNQCSAPGRVQGLTRDTSGTVWATLALTSTTGEIVQYKNGLPGCKHSILKPRLGSPGGIVVDDKGNLIVCDESPPAVYVIDPPYTKITAKFRGFSAPFRPALNASNGLLFVTDTAAKDVKVLKYPSGSLYATLGKKNRLIAPQGVAVGS